MSLTDALGRSAPLQGLLMRLQESGARFESMRGCLPADLLSQLRPGPLDDTGWTLLVDHSAAAAKLRQLIPRIDAHLRAAGWPPTEIRMKVRPRTA